MAGRWRGWDAGGSGRAGVQYKAPSVCALYGRKPARLSDWSASCWHNVGPNTAVNVLVQRLGFNTRQSARPWDNPTQPPLCHFGITHFLCVGPGFLARVWPAKEHVALL